MTKPPSDPPPPAETLEAQAVSTSLTISPDLRAAMLAGAAALRRETALSLTVEQTKPVDYVAFLKTAKTLVQANPLYKQFIEHTPLENDIAVWMADFAEVVSDAAVRSSAPSDDANQRAQLAHYGLLEEFSPWVGCDLTDHLAEALVVARRSASAPAPLCECGRVLDQCWVCESLAPEPLTPAPKGSTP